MRWLNLQVEELQAVAAHHCPLPLKKERMPDAREVGALDFRNGPNALQTAPDDLTGA